MERDKKGAFFSVRDLLFHFCALFLFLSAFLLLGFYSHADLVLFYNGDHRYGKATELQDGTVMLDVNGTIRYYKRDQIKEIGYGIEKPADGTVVSITDFTQIVGANILFVTGPITHRTQIKTQDGKQLRMDVEDGFDVPILHVFPARYGFYNRRGCFIAGLLINPSTRTWHALQLRAHLYDKNDRILSSKDFYIFRIPAATPQGPGQRKFEMNFPDVPYEYVDRMRLVRKF